jgi:hypothetical protein
VDANERATKKIIDGFDRLNMTENPDLSPYSDAKLVSMHSYVQPRQLNTRDIDGAYPQRFRHRSRK